ncbi:helix-turn-helix domain-containing protein [Chitinophaga sedimenti]|uniref:helix-turn-helix domain-containing protein n=1 Tax=Chitinophaga sedimenti TaxID=2033606 RepID=UPI0020044987|nr:helix-turn-helix domain-containing protein [Chitinophaga sedimenti]MCK7557555.1 helix-turn-helix domain-containing protein [Chitinophaga sedimenti]
MEADIREMKAMLSELVEVARGTGQPPQEEHIMSAREVADFLRIDVSLVYSKCSRGELPYSKLGKHYIPQIRHPAMHEAIRQRERHFRR